MDIFKLRTFYHVAKLGSLTLAAKQLNYSIPNVSRQLTSLEQMLNIKLLNRVGNKLHLTLQGETLYNKAAHILTEIDSLKDLIQDDSTTPAGLLRISTTQAFASICLVHYLKGFLERHPLMKLVIVADDRSVDIALRECDVALRPRVPDNPDLIQTPILSWRVGLYAHKDYLKQFGTPSTLDDLDHHRLIARGESGSLPYNIVNWSLVAGRPDNNHRAPYLCINSMSIIIDLTLQQMGIASLYQNAKEVVEGKLERVLPDIEGPTLDGVYIYPSNLKNSKRITCLQDYLLEQISKEKL